MSSPHRVGVLAGDSPAGAVQVRTSGMAIAGFVLALLSCSLLGLIFSIIGYDECKRSFGAVKGDGLALAGIVISTVWLLVAITWLAAIRHHAPY